jgi:hypothetical protein
LTFSKKGLLLLVGDYYIHLVLHEKDFGWIACWALNPKVMGLLWLMASVTSEGNAFWLKASIIGERGPYHF